MKYVKYDEDGKQVSSQETKLTEKDLPKPVGMQTELNIVEPLTKKRTISGAIIGVVIGIPMGAFAEILRLLGGRDWDDFFIAIVVFLIVVLVSTAVGYISGSMVDRD